MPDGLRGAFAPLHDDAARVTWADAAAVRARGRQRARRRTAVTAAAAAVLLGAAAVPAVRAATRDDPAPPPAVAVPDPTVIPPAALLDPAALGPRYAAYQVDDATLGDDRGGLDTLACEVPAVPEADRVVSRGRTLTAGPGGGFVVERLVRYRPGAAPSRLGALRRSVAACPRVTAPGTPDDGAQLTDVTPPEHAGQWLLVRQMTAGAEEFHAVARRGELELTLHVAGPGVDAAEAWRVATTAAARACAVTPC